MNIHNCTMINEIRGILYSKTESEEAMKEARATTVDQRKKYCISNGNSNSGKESKVITLVIIKGEIHGYGGITSTLGLFS